MAGGCSVPTLKLGTAISGVSVSGPGMGPSRRFEIPVPTLRLYRFRVPNWYLRQGGPLFDGYDFGMIVDLLGRLSVQADGIVPSLVLGKYACVLNDVVDQVFACAKSGQMSDRPVVGEILATLTRGTTTKVLHRGTHRESHAPNRNLRAGPAV